MEFVLQSIPRESCQDEVRAAAVRQDADEAWWEFLSSEVPADVGKRVKRWRTPVPSGPVDEVLWQPGSGQMEAEESEVLRRTDDLGLSDEGVGCEVQAADVEAREAREIGDNEGHTDGSCRLREALSGSVVVVHVDEAMPT